MSIQIERRIRKAEAAAAVIHPATRLTKRICCPSDGTEEDMARYHAEVDEAVRDGFFVIRLVPLEPKGDMQ